LQGKSHDIPKRLIWVAWLKVKSNGGAAGADGVTIEQFESRLVDNLYRLWNRMSSGSYFPGPVRAVEIPKKGGVRVLGIPNVVDRVAQTAAVLVLEPEVEKVFHHDSYGYRPGRSPVDAVRVCRQRCFKKDWVVDLDVKAFFDSVPWELMLKAVARHVTPDPPNERDTARRSDLTVDRQHLPALRLRHLDEPGVSRRGVRAVRG
jgi:group II intron reverse transcriptase/maturase